MTTNLIDYFTGRKKRLSYHDANDAYDFLRFHFDGPKRRYAPAELLQNHHGGDDHAMAKVLLQLIHNRRPSETSEIWEYRKTIFECITKEPTSAILRSLAKIKRSPDWVIRYNRKSIPAKIATGETLEDYCERKYPYYTSVTNWAFAILLKNILIDPNAVCLIAPLNTDAEANEYLKPFPTIFNSNQVYEYIENELAVLLSVEKTEKGGNVFIVVTPESIDRYEQVGNEAKYALTDSYAHGLEEMPCFKFPGIFRKAYANDILNESHIASIVPRLNEAAREYSDMQAEVVMHIFSEKWEYATQKCEECYDPMLGYSTGRIKNGKKIISCQKCNGTGLMGTAPYKKTVLNPTVKLDEKSIVPTPPMGYIQKDIEIAKLQNDRVDGHIYKALSTINMQFLANVPLNQSGKAKEVDKDELNNFIYSIAEDIVKVMDKVYCLTNGYRYKEIMPNAKDREKLLPTIPVPQKYDLLSSSYLLQDMKTATTDTLLSSVTLMAFETDFCAKRFDNQPQVREELELVFKLDPFPGATDQEKQLRKQGGGIKEIDYIISCNINAFVKRALDEVDNFFQQPFAAQRAVMEGYAGEVKVAVVLTASPEPVAPVG